MPFNKIMLCILMMQVHIAYSANKVGEQEESKQLSYDKVPDGTKYIFQKSITKCLPGSKWYFVKGEIECEAPFFSSYCIVEHNDTLLMKTPPRMECTVNEHLTGNGNGKIGFHVGSRDANGSRICKLDKISCFSGPFNGFYGEFTKEDFKDAFRSQLTISESPSTHNSEEVENSSRGTIKKIHQDGPKKQKSGSSVQRQ